MYRKMLGFTKNEQLRAINLKMSSRTCIFLENCCWLFIGSFCLEIIFYLLQKKDIAALNQNREYASIPRLFVFDDYEHCMLYEDAALYCTISFQIYPKNPENVSEAWNITQKLISTPKNYKRDLLRHGICVQTTCPNLTVTDMTKNNRQFIRKLETCYNSKFVNMDIKGEIKKIRCETNGTSYPIQTFDLIFAGFLITFIALVLMAWLYDIIVVPDHNDKKFSESFLGKYISSFSISQNWHRLNSIDYDDPDVRALSCIQGIRVFFMWNVIAAHSNASKISLPVSNPHTIERVSDRFLVRWIGDGTRYITTLTFFMISVWLLTYQFFVRNEGKKQVPLSYLFRTFRKRYLRLTPILAIMTGISATWLPHLGRGPFWADMVEAEYKNCWKNGWSNILYLNNIFLHTEMCSPHHWSMAVDTQYYVFGLFILWILWHHQNKMCFILGSILTLHLAQLFYFFYMYEWRFAFPLHPEMMYVLNYLRNANFNFSQTSTANISAVVAGIFYGYAFYKCRNKNVFTKKIYVKIWWFLSLGGQLLVFIVPGIVKHFNLFPEHQLLYNAIYGSLNRCCLAFLMGLWIFGMTQGQGHIFRHISEWTPVYVLGRLSYSAFLVHPLIQRFRAGTNRTPTYVSKMGMTFESFGDVAITYAAAALFSLLFEMPIAEMINRIEARFNKTSSTEDNEQKHKKKAE